MLPVWVLVVSVRVFVRSYITNIERLPSRTKTRLDGPQGIHVHGAAPHVPADARPRFDGGADQLRAILAILELVNKPDTAPGTRRPAVRQARSRERFRGSGTRPNRPHPHQRGLANVPPFAGNDGEVYLASMPIRNFASDSNSAYMTGSTSNIFATFLGPVLPLFYVNFDESWAHLIQQDLTLSGKSAVPTPYIRGYNDSLRSSPVQLASTTLVTGDEKVAATPGWLVTSTCKKGPTTV
ncbi:hypothetical protein F4782DRAFT_525322 [Xylaria castorea]|nr:hypothetical protein F4782DRAFT_525322 [Xylaria castorea]